jgi:hypothetical protein
LIESLHPALPVNLLHHLTTSLNARQVALVARSVLIKEEPGRAGKPHLLKDPLQRFGTVEEENQYGNIVLIRF